MVIWQRIKYASSSTVVAKGLCQQDRETKLLKPLVSPPAHGPAPDLTKASGKSLQGAVGRVGHSNGSYPIQPP